LISIGFTPAQVGIGTSAIFIGTLIFDLLGGVMLRKISERNLMRLSLAIITISTFLMYLYLNNTSVILLAILFGGGRSLWLLSRKYVILYYLDYSMR
jgi:cyanate permease